MKQTKNLFSLSGGVALLLFLASTAVAQIDIGNFTLSGEAEVGGMPQKFSGNRAKYEEYRDLPETVIVPQLQFMLGGKKEDFYLQFDSSKLGRDDQNYRLRFGRWGLLDLEFEWDQFPHLFNVDTARTPYTRNGGTFRLNSKALATVTPNTASLGNPAVPAVFPNGTPSTAICADNPFCTWLNAEAHPVDLKLFNGIARFKLRYTPSPGWTFTGNYWSNNNTGTRAISTLFGTSPGTYAIVELPEPIDYQTHNIELGGEYAASWWSLGLKYNASLFHNNTSTMVWDNPINLSNRDPVSGAITGACVDSRLYQVTGATGAVSGTNWGPCQGRYDLYPSNQAHTFTLTGTARLPLKTQFLSTVSYGWRLQDDSFLPFTSNRCYGTDPTACSGPLAAMPTISSRNLDGDVRPLMVNATLVNNYFDRLTLKAYNRFYNLNNKSKQFTMTGGIIVGDVGNPADVGVQTHFLEYSKNTLGLDGTYKLTRWLTAKLGYSWDRMHREGRQLLNADEHAIGPTFDVKPWNWLLVRASYKHFWRNASGYHDETDAANVSRMFDQASRQRDKVSLFAQFTPLDTLTFYGGFDFTGDRFKNSELGLQNDLNYSPSIGFIYAPFDWIRVFADYNWDRFDWLLRDMQRSSSSQDPSVVCAGLLPADQNNCLRLWNSRGREKIHTLSVGTDLTLIRDLLGLRIQYGFSDAATVVRNSGATCLNAALTLPFPASGACTPATDYPTITNRWHELLVRLDYQVLKNVGLKFGYYYNRYNSVDHGVDIMQPWMGDQDQWGIGGNANLGRSIFLGDQLKGPYTAHVGFIGLKLKF